MLRFCALLLVQLISTLAFSQNSIVYGIYTDDNAPYDNYTIIAGVDPVLGTVLDQDTIYGFNAVGLGTSTFDQLNGTYRYLAASFSSPFHWMNYDVANDDVVTSVPSAGTLNGLEYDMANGVTFGIGHNIVDSSAYFNEYVSTFEVLDFASGETIELSELPEISGVVLGATCLDPVNELYYLIDHSGIGESLIGIDINTGQIMSTVPLTTGENEYINELHLDILNGRFLGLHRNNGDLHLAEIDGQTGVVNDILDLTTEVMYFTPGASVYHQSSGRFILLTINDENSLLTINASNAEIISHTELDFRILELEIDNIEFAFANFATSTSEFEALEVQIGPNPSEGIVYFTVPGQNTPMLMRLFDLEGRLLEKSVVTSTGIADLSAHPNGVYLLEVSDLAGTKQSIRKLTLAR